MFSRPVSSGWNPVPTSSRAATRPRVRDTPSVGAVILARILSTVLFPAPLAPTMPSDSPSASEKLTSRSDQISRLGPLDRPIIRAAAALRASRGVGPLAKDVALADMVELDAIHRRQITSAKKRSARRK